MKLFNTVRSTGGTSASRGVIAVLALLCSAASGQEWAKARLEQSPRHMEYVTVKNGDRNIECFVAYPEVPHKAEAVVVIHDISAFGDWIRGMGDQLAEAGVIAIVPDLLSGMGPDGGGTDSFPSIDEARRKVSSLPPEQITSDLDAVASYVAKLPASNGKVSIAGFCWGGGQALRYATNNPNLNSAFVFYGYEPINKSDVERVKCPIYGFYAQNDARINAALPDVKRLMKEAKKTFDPVTYDGAGHGFMRHGEDPAGPDGNKKARAAAWERWKQILKEPQASQPSAISPTNAPIQIFNGKNLDGLYTWLKDTKLDDPRQVFRVTDGMLHVTGDGWGSIITKQSYRDYHLVLEFKWGEKAWHERTKAARDSGLLVHSSGANGGYQGIWMPSIEVQIIEGGVGDFILVNGPDLDGKPVPLSLTSHIGRDRDGEAVWKSDGELTTINTKKRHRINWFGRDPDWKDELGFRGKDDVESPHGQWTRLDVIADGGRITVFVNGTKVNEAVDVTPREGKLQLQSELAELFVRRWELYPIDRAPAPAPPESNSESKQPE